MFGSILFIQKLKFCKIAQFLWWEVNLRGLRGNLIHKFPTPACCENGSNTCGPFCASCSRYFYEVAEYIYSKKSFQPGLIRGLIFRKTEKIKKYFMYSELNLDWEDWDKLISKVLTCQLYLFIIKSRFLNFEHSLKVS